MMEIIRRPVKKEDEVKFPFYVVMHKDSCCGNRRGVTVFD